jgi:hypothetical protein
MRASLSNTPTIAPCPPLWSFGEQGGEKGQRRAMDAVGGQWAGNYDCSICRRKRLTASAFSRKQLEKHKHDEAAALKCKDCVASEGEKERQQAAAATIGAQDPSSEGELFKCGVCSRKLHKSSFSKTQIQRSPEERKCVECTSKLEAEADLAARAKRTEKLAKAQSETTFADEPRSKLAALSAESAAEAELVTGLKPIRLGRRGRGRGSGRGRGRG